MKIYAKIIFWVFAINRLIYNLLIKKTNFNTKTCKRTVAFFASFFIVFTLVSCSDTSKQGNDSFKNESNISSTIESSSSSTQIQEKSNENSTSVTNQVNSTATTTTGAKMEVSYIDVGQGDSILIQSPNGKNMLIDAGESSSQTNIQNFLKGKGINKIDVLVATHPHADHIGGIGGVRADQKGVHFKPIIPAGWDYFRLDGVYIQDKCYRIQYDKTGEKYGEGEGFSVFCGGRKVI